MFVATCIVIGVMIGVVYEIILFILVFS
ncbi:MAG: hypothetical protein ACRC7V_06185, partial [Lachnospiraceae bacterium]